MKIYTPIRKLSLALGLVLVVVSQQVSAISININFVGGLTASQQGIFTQAELFWENTLTGYQAGINPAIEAAGITINASDTLTSDGVGGLLGSAGPTNRWEFIDTGGLWMTAIGAMDFDSADLANLEGNGTLINVILHEMAHVLGFGTFWDVTTNGLYTPGALPTDPGQYTGAAALAAYRAEFDPLATFVPVEQDGGPGTAGGHWDENVFGAGLTGITDGNGNDLRDELMTGWLNPNIFVSNTTKQSFVDLGYTVAAVPVPAAVWLFISGFGLLFGFARKRQTIR